MKKRLALLLAVLLLFCFAGCKDKQKSQKIAEKPAEPAVPMVGISMPEETALWQESAQVMAEMLSQLGYETEVRYAMAEPVVQTQQIDLMIEKGALCLIIAPVDATALFDVLEKAEAESVPVIAYDRYLTDSETVDGLVSFDYSAMGAELGAYIIEAKGLDALEEEESLSVEFFMGSAEDHTALLFHQGLMNVLQPYLDAGLLFSPSSRTSFADTYILQAEPETAGQKLQSYLKDLYDKEVPAIICTWSDEMANACKEVLAKSVKDQEKWPLISGQGGSELSAQNIEEGLQAVTFCKDYEALAKDCVDMAVALMTGVALEAERLENNNAMDVPAVIRQATLANAENYLEFVSVPLPAETEE